MNSDLWELWKWVIFDFIGVFTINDQYCMEEAVWGEFFSKVEP